MCSPLNVSPPGTLFLGYVFPPSEFCFQWPVTSSSLGMINVCWGEHISGWVNTYPRKIMCSGGNTFPVTPASARNGPLHSRNRNLTFVTPNASFSESRYNIRCQHFKNHFVQEETLVSRQRKFSEKRRLRVTKENICPQRYEEISRSLLLPDVVYFIFRSNRHSCQFLQLKTCPHTHKLPSPQSGVPDCVSVNPF